MPQSRLVSQQNYIITQKLNKNQPNPIGCRAQKCEGAQMSSFFYKNSMLNWRFSEMVNEISTHLTRLSTDWMTVSKHVQYPHREDTEKNRLNCGANAHKII